MIKIIVDTNIVFSSLLNPANSIAEFLLKFANKWSGLVDSAWENPSNWSCGIIPDGYTDVIIQSDVPNLPEVNSFALCRSLQLQNGASIVIKTGFNLNVTNWN